MLEKALRACDACACRRPSCGGRGSCCDCGPCCLPVFCVEEKGRLCEQKIEENSMTLMGYRDEQNDWVRLIEIYRPTTRLEGLGALRIEFLHELRLQGVLFTLLLKVLHLSGHEHASRECLRRIMHTVCARAMHVRGRNRKEICDLSAPRKRGKQIRSAS